MNKIVFKIAIKCILYSKGFLCLSKGECNKGFSSKAACHNSLLSCLSCQNHFIRRAALSIWHQLAQSIQRGESSFQQKCMDFHEIHPRVAYDLANLCISWSVQTNKWRTTHGVLCGYYSFYFEFSFEFIWIFQNINNKRFQDFSLK